MASRKTIAQHVWDVYYEYYRDQLGNSGSMPIVSWGDCCLLDRAASRATHTNLMDLHPLTRHARILAALRGSKLFERIELQRLGGYRGGSGYNVGFRLIVPDHLTTSE